MAKIIQIASVYDYDGADGGSGRSLLYGLDENGNLFYLRENIRGVDEWVYDASSPSSARRAK